MSRPAPVGFTRLLLPLGAVIVSLCAPVIAQEQLSQANPMEVTTDTPEYCRQLLSRVRELRRLASSPVPHDVGDLTAEGQRMCDHGQTRGGIMRLRSAVMLMEKSNGDTSR